MFSTITLQPVGEMPTAAKTTVFLLLLLITSLLLDTKSALAQLQDGNDGNGGNAADSDLKIDTEAVRKTITNILRDGTGAAGQQQGGDNEEDGYSEAAMEYLEHIQSVLADVKSPSEIYLRDQVADLDALHGLLTALEAALPDCRPLATSPRLLLRQLVKGPARKMLLSALEPGASSSPAYTGSGLATRVVDAASELRRFLNNNATASLTEDLRRYGNSLPAGSSRDYLNSVLDRVLELESQPTRFEVKFPADGAGNEGAEPEITRVADEQDEKLKQHGSTSTADDDADGDSADAGGRDLFDQVIARRAASAVAAQLVGSGGPSAAAARIAELRGRRYQPAGMKVILDSIEQCLQMQRKSEL